MYEEKAKRDEQKRSKYEERDRQREEEQRKIEEYHQKIREEQEKKAQEEFEMWKVILFFKEKGSYRCRACASRTNSQSKKLAKKLITK